MNAVWHAGKYGLNTLLSSIQFFYRHLSLVFLSLIPSSLRAYQMWNPANAPFWIGIIVELARIILVLCIICFISKASIKTLRSKAFWNKFGNLLAAQLKNNWPHRFIAQIVIFIAILYGFGNFLLAGISKAVIPFIDVQRFESYDPSNAYNACLFFLKNMSIIPLAIVYLFKVCGLKPMHN